jgi:ferredoxin
MRVVVNPDMCQGHTLCHMAAPDVFGLSDEDGHAEALVDVLPEHLIQSARKAVATCPEKAISLQE